MNFSFDGGHGYSKAIGPKGRVLYPSILGEVQPGLMSENGVERIETTDGDWLVGQSARLFSHSQIIGRDENWSLSSEYRALLLYGVSELISPETGSVIVDLVAGLPINDFKRHKEEFESLLNGLHLVQRPARRALNIHIRNVKTLPQGFAPAMPYRKEGNRVGTLDIGTRTTNWMKFRGDDLIPKSTGSNELGASGLLDILTNRIEEETHRQYEPFEIVEILAGKRECKSYGQSFNASEIIDYHTSLYAQSLISSIAKAQGNTADLDHLLIFGGGALLVGNEIAKRYPQAIVLPDPQWATAQAQYEYAKWKFR